ncbi:MAG: WG repeat-containing protein [Actinobacteria bacterium]|nr:WG repeat-containing protein [Actinomycetota bacterium]
MIGEILIDRYRIKKELGVGGMASVYLAEDVQDVNGRYAVKVLHPQYAKNEKYIARFTREAETARRLNHPNIVRVYGQHLEGDIRFLLMEYVDGTSLAKLLESRKLLPVNQALDIAGQVALALDYASNAGVAAHRDIKPQNILIDLTGATKVTDFGIAKASHREGLTHTAMFMGTPQYISPEQGRGGEALGIGSDIYSLSVVLFEMLTGRTPFAEDTPYAIVQLHVKAKPPRAGDFREGIPEEVEAILIKGLAKKPKERFKTPAEMALALERSISKAPDDTVFKSLQELLGEALPSIEGIAGIKKLENLKDIQNIQNIESGTMSKPQINGTVLKQRRDLLSGPNMKSRFAPVAVSSLLLLLGLGAFYVVPEGISIIRQQGVIATAKGISVSDGLLDQIKKLPPPAAEPVSGFPELIGEPTSHALLNDPDTVMSRNFTYRTADQGIYAEVGDKKKLNAAGDLPASVSMILSSWGEEVGPYAIAKRLESGASYTRMSAYDSYLEAKGYAVISTTGGDIDLLQESVKNGTPVIVALSVKGYRSQHGRAIVIRGYNERLEKIIFSDPSGITGSMGNTKLRVLDYGALDLMWAERFKRSYMIIFKKKCPVETIGIRLFPIMKGGKWGYIDKTLNVRIAPYFDDGREFIDGLAPVRIGGKWGYIDKSGKLGIALQYDEVSYFMEDAARVRVGDKWGYIDRAGEMIVDPQFYKSREFTEGLAPVKVGDKWGYIDKSGRMAVESRFDDAWVFINGLAKVEVGGRWGYIDKSGKVVIDPKFDEASYFVHDIAQVKVGNRSSFIDMAGKAVVKPNSDKDWMFNEGLPKVKVGDGWGYIDEDGRITIDPYFEDAWIFSEGLAKIRAGDKWGYIDKQGKTAIAPQFDEAARFSSGMARVRTGGKWGYIDKRGKYVWGPTD